MISEIIGHLPFAMRSALTLLKLVEGQEKLGNFQSLLCDIPKEKGARLLHLRHCEGSQYPRVCFLFCVFCL